MALQQGYFTYSNARYEAVVDLMGDFLIFDDTRTVPLITIEAHEIARFSSVGTVDLIRVYRAGHAHGTRVGMDRIKTKVRNALA